MKLEFDSIDELENFTDWALRYGAAWVAAQRGVSGSAGATTSMGQVTIAAGGVSGTAGQAFFDTPLTPVSHEGPSSISVGTSGASEGTPAEPAKRKRRTKAEIEADEAEAAITRAAEAARASGEASLEAARATLRDKAPESSNPFDVQHTAAGMPPPDADPSPATEEPVDTTVTPFKHLTRAREFIAKHGMPKYNESFAKAGLDANVMAYTAEQRALHLEALAALEAA